MEANQLYFENNLSKFKHIKGNRDLNEAHIERLRMSIMEHGQITPIIVNNKGEVIDGQHRLEALRRLQRGAWVYNGNNYTLVQAQAMNSIQKNWTNRQYLDSYCEIGIQDYIILNDFVMNYGFSIPVSISLLCGIVQEAQGELLNEFKDGKFKIKSLVNGEVFARKITDFSEYYSGYRKVKFVRAMMRIFGTRGYNHSEMMEKVRIQAVKAEMLLEGCTNQRDYLSALSQIYNWKRGRGNVGGRIDFLRYYEV